MAEQALPGFAGPARIVIRQASAAGPFAGRPMRLRPLRFSVVNIGTAAATLRLIGLDPVQRGAGTTVPPQLTLRPAEPAADAAIAPGAHLLLELTGEIPARPGAYTTTARLQTDAGSLAIPISIEVPASQLWGIGCMLFGLFCLSVISFLADEGAVRTRLHDALAARQDIHVWLEANPAPQGQSANIDAMNRNFDAAVTALAARRPISVLDHRAADATDHLAAANAAAEQLRHTLSGRLPGAAEIDDLTREWTELQASLHQIASLAAAPTGPPAPGLAGRLDAFLVRYRIRFLQQPMGWMTQEMDSELNRARLAYAAGQGEEARDLAINSRVWLRRSARTLNTALTGYRGALVEAGRMAGLDAALRARIAAPDIPPDARTVLLAMLDDATAKMQGDAWLPEWAAANRALNLAYTQTTRVTATVQLARFKAETAKIDASTDSSDVEAAEEALQTATDHSLAGKKAALHPILKLWRNHVAAITAPATRTKMQSAITAAAAAIDSGDMKSVGPLFQSLSDDWIAWNARLVDELKDRLDHQECLDSFTELQRETGGIEASLRERPAEPALADWDRRLDQIRLDMQRHGPDAQTISQNCMAPLLALGSRATALSGEILATTITDLEVPALTRMRLARDSGMATAVAAIEASFDRPWVLGVAVTAPEAERVVGRTLSFSINHADPVWGAGVLLAVAFGDGTPPSLLTAEQLRQGRAVTHDYAAPITARVTVIAAERFKPGTIDPVDTALGAGGAGVLIAPSRVTRAELLADDILNLRFAIALLIALVVYYWRYQSKTAILGARGIDYVETFALGFAANAAVSNLPDVLAKLVPS